MNKTSPKGLINNSRFSPMQLLTFVLVFGVIGAYILISSFAAPITPTASIKTPAPDAKARALMASRELVAGAPVLKEAKVKGDTTKHAKVKGELTTVTTERTKDLKELMKTDPKSARQAILPDDALAKLKGEGVKTEEKVTLTGKFNIFHVDDSTGDHIYRRITTDDGKIYTLNDDQTIAHIVPGSTIKARGWVVDDQLLVAAPPGTPTSSLFAAGSADASADSSTNTAPITVTQAAPNTTSLGTIREAVIMGNFGGPSNRIDANNVRAVYSDIARWVAENSKGKANLVVDFFGPYDLTSQSCSSLNNGEKATSIRNAAKNEVNFDNYDPIAYMTNCNDGGDSGIYLSSEDIHSSAHELAHRIAGSHGGYYSCNPEVFVPPNRFDEPCFDAEYEEPYDVLGTNISRDLIPQLGAVHKLAAGWLDSTQITTVNNASTSSYTLAPYENGNGLVALKIPRGNSGSYFTVEYRQPLGFDSFINNPDVCDHCNANQGALIRLGGIYFGGHGGGGSDSLIIDTTPGSFSSNPDAYRPTGDGNDGTLLPGQSFTDPEYGTIIKVISASSSGLSVQVTPGSLGCTYNQPSVSSISPYSQTVTAGQPATYSFSVTNNDSAACPTNKFKLVASGNYAPPNNSYVYKDFINSGSNLRFTPDLFSLAPGASKTITITASTPAGVPNSPYGPYFAPSIGRIFSKPLGVAPVSISGFSYQVSGTTDTQRPSAPTNVVAKALGSAVGKITWTASSDNIGVAGYEIYKNGNAYGAGRPLFIDTSLYPSTSYSYSLRAFDAAGNFSDPTTVSLTTPAKTDFTPPGLPYTVNPSSTDHNFTLNWGKAVDNVGIGAYLVYPCVISFASSAGNCSTAAPNQTSILSSLFSSQTEITDGVTTIDGDGNFMVFASTRYNVTTAVQGDPVSPSKPQQLYQVSGTKDGVQLSWQASTDNKAIAGYWVYRGCCKLAFTATNSYLDKTGKSTGYRVQAVDADGSLSPQSDEFWAQGVGRSTSDTTPPTVSLNSHHEGDTVSGTISLQSSASDASGIYSVIYFLDGKYIGNAGAPYSLNLNTTKYGDGTHWLVVLAKDASADSNGNVGSVTPINLVFHNSSDDITPPHVSITAPTNGVTVSGPVPITANATDNAGFPTVVFAVDGNTVSTASSSPYAFTWNSSSVPNGNHTITATATDAAGNSAVSNVTVTTANADAVKPTAPSNLSATAASQTSINLSWTASSDNMAVTGYYIIRGGVTIAQTSGIGTTYSDTGLNPATSYSYQVEAFDASANISDASNMATATTQSPAPDTTKPSTPTNLVAGVVNANQVNLSWTASTDEVSVDHYDLYRSNTKVASIPAASATDPTTHTVSYGDTTTLPRSSYSYWVYAFDSSNNKSLISTKASVTTPTLSTTLGSLTGRLTGPSGTPLASAKVAYSLNGRTTSASSNTNGNYTLSSVPAGSTSFSYSLTGYLTQSLSLTINPGANTVQNATLHKLGTITGTVTSSSTNLPLSNVVISYQLNGVTKTAKTSKGIYTITGLPAGSYTLSYALSGYTTQTQTVTVTQDQTTTQNLTLVHL